MKDRRSLLHGLVLFFSSLLLVDQYLFTTTEPTTYQDSMVLRERHSNISYSKWRRWSDGPRPARKTYSYSHWYIAHLANGRWFQLQERDNGVLQHGDGLILEVAPITGRVLRFRPDDDRRMRVTADAFEDLVPYLFLLAPLSLWLLVGNSGADGRYYLHFLLIVIGLSFLIALFASSYPLMRALGLVPVG